MRTQSSAVMGPFITETTPSSPMNGQSTLVDTIFFYIGVVGMICIPIAIVLCLWARRQKQKMDKLDAELYSYVIGKGGLAAFVVAIAVGIGFRKDECHMKQDNNSFNIPSQPVERPSLTKILRSLRKSLGKLMKRRRSTGELPLSLV
ncbi:hypothetical protein LSAT2_030413 [Lamellibrachia satsuma]|nr:hypothetical protein LSAT2_030413 [Lamellibrachia satsuma]